MAAMQPRMGELLPVRARRKHFVMYSLKEQKKRGPFCYMNLDDLEENCLSEDPQHHHFLTKGSRLQLQIMTSSTMEEPEVYYLFLQGDESSTQGTAMADAEEMNMLYAETLTE